MISAVAVLVVALLGGGLTWNLRRPGPGPQGLTAESIDGNVVALAWQPPPGPEPQAYVISRDGRDVARVAGVTDYQDRGLDPMTDYRFSVRAVLGGKESTPTAEVAVTTVPWGPDDLWVEGVSSRSVGLAWPVPRGEPPEEYVIQRDGTDLATVSAGRASYTDERVRSGWSYTYLVVAVQHGRRSRPSPARVVKAVDPPLSEARFSGQWTVQEKVVKNNGTRLKRGFTLTDEWTFTPSCEAGACSVTLDARVADMPLTVDLVRSGARYTGSTKAAVTTCRGTKVTNTLTVAVTVTGAEVADGGWNAARWSGTLTLSSPYTVSGRYYCPKQNAVFSVAPASGPSV